MKLLDNQNELLTRIKQINKVPHQSFKNWALKSLVALSSIFIVMISLFIPTEKNHHLDNSVVVAPSSNKLQPTAIAIKSVVSRPHIIPSNESKGQTTVASIQNESKTVPDKQEKEYNEVVSETLRWLQSRASNKQFANYQLDEDSVALQIAERLVISSAITNYQLKKEILNRKLESITDEFEASEFLKNSKEWNDIKQYEILAKIYLAKHPEMRITDSLVNKF
jgi:hypothetical protein